MLGRTKCRESRPTYLTGEVDLNGLDTNVLGTSRHGGEGVANWEYYVWRKEGKGEH
jgi:hypothetical protein